ncbi:MAG: bifunctional oligoribonuclease/PAP phosphatase NrnA [Candidatus Aenigmatarchaeota archaeon]
MENTISALKAIKGNVLVLTHHNADIDALGSALALSLCLKQKGISAQVGASESVSRPAKKIAEGHSILIDPDCSKYNNVIVVDTSVPEQLAHVKNLKADVLIDHHEPGPLAESAKVKWIETRAKSTAQMVFRIIMEMKCKLTKRIALLLAAGIVADTAHLRLAGKEELRILLELFEGGIRMDEIMKLIEAPVEISDRIAGLKAATRASVFRLGELLVVFSKLKSHEAASCRALIRTGADIAVVAAVKKNEIRISSRARRNIEEHGINLAEIFKEVGKIIGGTGGGHAQAGSANGKKPGQVHKAFSFVLDQIEKKTKKKAKRIE